MSGTSPDHLSLRDFVIYEVSIPEWVIRIMYDLYFCANRCFMPS